MCLNSIFTQRIYIQERFRRVHHMEIVPFRLTANFQPDLTLSVFLERFSVCSSETSCTITEASLKIITSPSSRSTQPSWLKFTSLISCSIVYTPCQARHSDLRPPPRSPSCRGLLVTNSLVRNDSFFSHTQHSLSLSGFPLPFAFATDLAFALALVAILALSFALALAVAAASAFALAFALALAFAFAFALAYIIHPLDLSL